MATAAEVFTDGVMPVDMAPNRRVPIIYSDLIAGVALSPQVSRISLAITAGDTKDGKQPVHPVVEVAIPTAALIEFCQNFLKHAASSADTLLQMNENVRRVIEQLKTPSS